MASFTAISKGGNLNYTSDPLVRWLEPEPDDDAGLKQRGAPAEVSHACCEPRGSSCVVRVSGGRFMRVGFRSATSATVLLGAMMLAGRATAAQPGARGRDVLEPRLYTPGAARSPRTASLAAGQGGSKVAGDDTTPSKNRVDVVLTGDEN